MHARLVPQFNRTKKIHFEVFVFLWKLNFNTHETVLKYTLKHILLKTVYTAYNLCTVENTIFKYSKIPSDFAIRINFIKTSECLKFCGTIRRGNLNLDRERPHDHWSYEYVIRTSHNKLNIISLSWFESLGTCTDMFWILRYFIRNLIYQCLRITSLSPWEDIST